MSNRGRRGGAAALFAARMTEEVEPTDEEIQNFGDVPDPADDDPADDEPADVDEPEDDGPSIDYSHVEDEPADEEPEPEKPAAPDAVAELRAQLEAMQAERDAEKARAAVLDEAAELRQNQVTISRALGAAKGSLTAAKADYAKAAAAGDWTTAAEHQAAIAAATADIREFEGAQDEVAAAVEAFNRGKRRTPEAAPKQQQADPFEAAIAVMSDPSKEWCRRNKADLQKSPARGAKAQAVHLEAVDAGIKPDTPEYFDYLDKEMGYRTVTKTTKTPRPTGQPRVAAPAGGRSGPPAGNSAGEVKLSADEVAIAKTLGMTTKKYAAYKLDIIKNGKDTSRGGPTYSNVSHLARR
jgi:hypothetical protein